MSARNGPGDSNAGPVAGDRRTAERARQLDPTADLRQIAPGRTAPIHVWAHGYLVVGTRGRCRLLLVVAACVFCGRSHQHGAAPTFTSGKRLAACHEGRYVVHLGTIAGQAA